MNRCKSMLLLLCLTTIGHFTNAQTKVVATYPLSGNGRYDYLTSAKGSLLYVSHGDRVHILDKRTDKEIHVITRLSGVHGIALDEADKKGFISNGTANNLTVFDLNTNKIMGTIATEKNPDAIFYDDYSKMILVGNGKSNSLSIIDPKAEKIIQTIDLGGKPEAAVSNNKGQIYVNVEDKNEIVEIDIKSFSITKRFSLAPQGEKPAGLAIDRKNKLLFAGCGNKSLLVVDYNNWKIVQTYPIGDHCDGVAFNAKTNTVFASNGEGTLTVLQKKGTAFQSRTIQTAKGAKTLAIDEKINTVYVSAADFGNEKDSNGKLIPLPDTFRVLKVK